MPKNSTKPVTKYSTRKDTKKRLKKNCPDSDSDSEEENIFLEDEEEDEEEDEDEDEYETCSEDDSDDEEEEEEASTDSSYKPPVRKSKKNRKNKRVIIDEEEDEEDEEDEEEESGKKSVDRSKIQKLIAKIFPSKYMQQKIGDRIADDIEDGIEETKKKLKRKSKSKSTIYSNGKKLRRNDAEEEEDDDEDDLYEDDGKADETVWLTFGGGADADTEVYDDAEDDADCNSDDEQMFMKETYQTVEMPSIPEVEKKKAKLSKKATANAKAKEDNSELDDVEADYLDLVDTKKQLTTQLHKRPKSKILLKAIDDCDRSIKKLVKKARIKNAKNFHKLIHEDTKETNEVDYFKKNLSNKEQLRVMRDLTEINKHMNVDKPYRLALLESPIPPKMKALALQKLNILKMMDPGDNEYYKIQQWVHDFMRIPFGIYKDLSVRMEDGPDICHEFMQNAMTTLDECVYGLDDAKLQIIQLMGQWITNPDAVGTAIAIKGPPGTGKCHGFNTEILMHDGSVKMVQDIVVGDLVMGDDSTPRQVLSLGRGQDEMYEVLSNKGTSYVVNSEHILCLKPSGMNRIKPIKSSDGKTISYKTIYFNLPTCNHSYKTFPNKEDAESYLCSLVENQKSDIVQISVKNYLKLPVHVQETLKGYSTGVEFESKPILFDPYIIGVWLGDGCSSKSQITNQDAAILTYMRNELKKDNLSLRYISKYDYAIVSDEYNRPHHGISKTTGHEFENKNVFTESLRHYDLVNNKHIPHDYKTNDRNVRLQVLAGIIDTDGWFDINNRYFEITQKSKRLSDDILFLARSLGFAATQNECDKYCVYNGEKKYGLYYRVNIYGEHIDTIPTKCPRKQAIKKTRTKNSLVSKITVIPKGVGNYYGFELDNNHRYVLGNFVVTHNTSLVKEGISKILGRAFEFIALGGSGDASFLEGHSYTYEGSKHGKILQILMDSKCMNPVIYFDELDKVSDTARGEEIIGLLTHLTDTTQNSDFRDKYFSEVPLDLNKCLFIFSYNDESKVNPILRDRMYRIQTKGYDAKEKLIIARKHLLPKIREQVKFTEEEVIIPDDTIQYIVSNTNLTNEESGVRNLKRCLEIIHTKLNLFRLVKPGSTNTFTKEMPLTVTFPFTVTRKEVDVFIKNNDKVSQSMLAMYT